MSMNNLMACKRYYNNNIEFLGIGGICQLNGNDQPACYHKGPDFGII